jgi:hypothetical protein
MVSVSLINCTSTILNSSSAPLSNVSFHRRFGGSKWKYSVSSDGLLCDRIGEW